MAKFRLGILLSLFVVIGNLSQGLAQYLPSEPGQASVGQIASGQLPDNADGLIRLGMLKDNRSFEPNGNDSNLKPDATELYRTITIISSIGLLIGLVLVLSFRLNRRWQQEIRERKQAEATIEKERDFMRAILHWVESIVVVINLEGHLVSFNRAAEKCSGYNLSEIQDRPFWDILIPPAERDGVREAILNVKKAVLSSEYENHWVTKTGQQRLIHWFNSVLNGPDGTIEYILCTGLDLTERSEAEQALRRSEEHYQSVLENMEEGYFETDLAGNFVVVNKASIETLGYSKSELIGMNNRAVMDQITAKKVFTIYNRIFQTRIPQKVLSYEVIRKQGERRTVEVSTSLKYDSGGQPIGFYGVSRDVTERIRMERIMVQTEKMMSVGGLAAGMAHEINNPLAVIVQGAQNIQRRFRLDLKGNIEAAARTNINLADLNRYLEARSIDTTLESIQVAGKRAADIINNMLRFSRKSDFQMRQVHVRTIVERALDLAAKDYDLEKKYDFRHIAIDLQIDDRLPAVECIEQEIEQVLLNILGNAAQALCDQPRSVRSPHIIIRAVDEDNRVRLEIEDNGPGIKQEIKNRIFEPFFTTKPTGVGTGLGLSVSYMIVTNNHKGTLEVESEPDWGTKLIIRLPYRQAM